MSNRRLNALAELVREMRHQQKGFFLAPRGSDKRAECLSISKELERRVDREVEEILDRQPKLFGE